MIRSIKVMTLLGVSSLALLTDAAPAAARGFVTFGFGVPLFYPAPYPYYAPPPAYYYPAYPAPAPQPSATGGAAEECREYQATTTIDGQPQQIHGTACRQPDGSWKIKN